MNKSCTKIVSSLCDIQTGTDLLVVVALDNAIIKLIAVFFSLCSVYASLVCISVLSVFFFVVVVFGFQVPK